MKSIFTLLIFCIFSASPFFAQMGIKDYIDEAGILNKEGKTEEAIALMREADETFPENPDILALLGFYVGKSAGETSNFQLQASRAFESFAILDRAVGLDPENLNARFYRGLMSVKVPPFLGKLNQGIEDLEILLSLLESSSDSESQSYSVQARMFLAEGYEKKDDLKSALKMWEEILALSDDPEISENAKSEIGRLSLLVTPSEDTSVFTTTDPDEILSMARSRYEAGEYFRAETLLIKASELDDKNIETHSLLALVYLALAEVGYAENISEDTDYRTNLCFKAMGELDKILELEPDNTEFRLLRGIMGVQFPFFVGKLEQGISDLNIVLSGDAEDSDKAAALFHLGYGYRKLGASKWISVVNDYPSSEEADWVFEVLNPKPVAVDQDSIKEPCLIVEFALGFLDELPPQTAVWIEDERGNFVKTVYVSGFAGHVKAVQVTLPLWGNSSNFETDATTAASIDLGNHVYIWDLKDTEGNTVPRGIYTVNIEVSFWPSYKYETSSLSIDTRVKDAEIIKTDGLLIPYIELRYME